MAKITIDQKRCKGCLLCIKVCPRNLIKIDAKLNARGVKPVKISAKDNKQCLGCMQCALICPDCCIEVYK